MSVLNVSLLYTNLNAIGIVVLFLLTNSTNFLLSPRSLRYFAGISLIKIRKFAEIDTMCLILLKSTISEINEDVECTSIVMRNFFLKL